MQGMELLTTSEESHREGGWRDRQRQVAKGFTKLRLQPGTVVQLSMKEVEAELHKARGRPELYHEVFVSKQTKNRAGNVAYW